MSLLKILGLAPDAASRGSRNVLADAIREHLEDLPPDRAEFVAAFAGLLARVAHADEEISAAERDTLRALIAARVGLSPQESATVAEIVTEQATAVSRIEYALLTRTFNELATDADKEHLIDCLYAIATVESSVSLVEDEEIRSVARALLIPHSRYIAIRQRYRDQLEVLQALRKDAARGR